MKMYFIALVLPSTLNDKILQFKNLMLERFGSRVALKSPAHITLIPPCWMEEEKETGLKTDLDELCRFIEPFKISTQNFSAFPPKTIFISVSPNEQLNAVKIQTDKFFSERNYELKCDTRPFHPHITIATRDLYKKAFAEAWPVFAEKKFREEWEACGISLLRHNQKNWDVVHTSQFKLL